MKGKLFPGRGLEGNLKLFEIPDQGDLSRRPTTSGTLTQASRNFISALLSQ